MITDPLGIKNYHRQSKLGFNVLPIIDLIIIGFFLTLNNLAFFIPSGIDLSLPKSSLHTHTKLPTAAVLTIKNNEMILFQGYKLSLDQLSDKLKLFLEQKTLEDAALLVKADKYVTTQEIVTICNLAKNAGFSSIKIATEQQ